MKRRLRRRLGRALRAEGACAPFMPRRRRRALGERLQLRGASKKSQTELPVPGMIKQLVARDMAHVEIDPSKAGFPQKR